MTQWLAAIANVCYGQASSGVSGSRMGDHPGFQQRILAPHTHVLLKTNRTPPTNKP